MYPVKQFLTTILLAPLLFQVYELIVYASSASVRLYFTFVILSFGFALPTYVAYHILYVQLKKQRIRPAFQKMILNLVAILGVVITMKILNGPGEPFFDPITLLYSVTIVLTSLLFKITENLSELKDV